MQTFTGSIAAPVFGIKGAVVGCVCFVYLKKVARDEALIDELKEALLMMSHSLSVELGWHPRQA